LDFEAGLKFAIEDLLVQVRRLPAFRPVATSQGGTSSAKPLIVLDSTIETMTGQRTSATQTLDKWLLHQAAFHFETLTVQPVTPESLSRAQYILAGSLTPKAVDGKGGFARINLSITEIRSGFVIAQTSVQLSGQGIDATPSNFYLDSPALTKDRVTEGQVKTSQTPTGEEADTLYLERLPVTALINQALAHYEVQEFSLALRLFNQAATRPEGQQMRVFVGLYSIYAKLGEPDAAAKAFSRVVALGLSSNNLSIKFLFEPGKIEFIADPKVRAPYPMWIKTLAQETVAAQVCLRILGHTSRTGTDSINERLSLQRATTIQRQLTSISPELRNRLTVEGRGSRENLVGSGTDDLRDSADRRVEFSVVGC
jgi:outer membrane protein OmpA-like peptidoglycan-associated protein